MSIGGIGVRFHSSHREIIRQIKQRYPDFMDECSNNALISVIIDEDWQGEDIREQEQILGSSLYISKTANTLGRLDLEKDSGELVLSRKVSIAEIEYFIRGVFAILSFKNGCLMIHSAGVVRNNKAFIFIGHSGSGKSTISQLSKKFDVLNDDLIFLKRENKLWQAYSTPFWNPDLRREVNMNAPIDSLYCLAKDYDVYIQAIEKSIALAELITNVPVIPLNPIFMDQLIDLSNNLLDQVEMYRLHFRKDATFWDVIKTHEIR